MAWRLPIAALLAVIAGLPLAILFDWGVRGVSPADPYAPSWYALLGLVAYPVTMFGMALGGTIAFRMRKNADRLVPATLAGAVIGLVFAGVAIVFAGAPAAPLRVLALGYGAVFGVTGGWAFRLFFRMQFAKLQAA
ncbi:hypothetical protein [Stakelama saccharophila]|uniref:Transmembrane protein n=1 Tax=Stakelama saccharophila TaxID=3075605 RepID=A0ABZ0BBP1_9SPHN|nr:hypothetical protein [Stakelama sp. W311]WNO54845.1 hypothetical protein RPR59_06265 [Stakelama sp. W311]